MTKKELGIPCPFCGGLLTQEVNWETDSDLPKPKRSLPKCEQCKREISNLFDFAKKKPEP